MTIGQRIGALVAVIMTMVIVSSVLSYRSIDDVMAAMQLRKLSSEIELQLNEVITDLLNAETGQRGFIITAEDAYLEPYTKSVAAIGKLLDGLRAATVSDAVLQRKFVRLEQLVQTKVADMATSISIRREKGFEAAQSAILTHHGLKSMDDVRKALDEMEIHQHKVHDERIRQAAASVDRAKLTMLVMALLSLLVSALASWVVTRSITKPLTQLAIGTEKLGSGDLDHRIEGLGDDETGNLAKAFNAMAARLNGMLVSASAQAAQRDKVLAAVTETALQLATSSQELLAGATQQATGMQEQAAAIVETATVVDEVAHTATQALERAKFVATAARRSEEVGMAGKQAVDETVQAILLANGQAGSVAGNIASLAAQTQAIGEIVALITDIADQTNLLALNAAIEASRAGEHGRGFSVVATEVKSLAEESKQATRRVRQILGDIQKMANTAVLSTEEGARGMATATKQADNAGQKIQQLGSVIAEVADAASQIAASAGQQANGLTQIHQAIRDIRQVSTQNLAATHQAQRAATDLATLGTNLTALLAASRVTDG